MDEAPSHAEETRLVAEDGVLELVAYFYGPKPAMEIVPASRWRTWMNETFKRGANRCLPLLVANEAGWFLVNERTFTAEWNGGEAVNDVIVQYESVRPMSPASANFGHGVLTFVIPYLFRTPPGWDLQVRGPANLPKDGIAPLDGLVETDWAVTTFTMNWKFTRPGSVTFEAGEPICMVRPIPRHGLEHFQPSFRRAQEGDDVTEGWEAASRSRHELQVQKWLATFTGDEEALDGWEKDYFRGRTHSGREAPEHVTKRRLKPFADPDDA